MKLRDILSEIGVPEYMSTLSSKGPNDYPDGYVPPMTSRHSGRRNPEPVKYAVLTLYNDNPGKMKHVAVNRGGETEYISGMNQGAVAQEVANATGITAQEVLDRVQNGNIEKLTSEKFKVTYA